MARLAKSQTYGNKSFQKTVAQGDIRNSPMTLQQTVLDIIELMFSITPGIIKSPNKNDWVVIEAFLLGLDSLLAPYVEEWREEYSDSIREIRELSKTAYQGDRQKFVRLMYGRFFRTIVREFGNPNIALLPVPRETVVM